MDAISHSRKSKSSREVENPIAADEFPLQGSNIPKSLKDRPDHTTRSTTAEIRQSNVFTSTLPTLIEAQYVETP